MLNIMYWILVIGGLYIFLINGILATGKNFKSKMVLNMPCIITGTISFIIGLSLLGFINLSGIIIK